MTPDIIFLLALAALSVGLSIYRFVLIYRLKKSMDAYKRQKNKSESAETEVGNSDEDKSRKRNLIDRG